ncbi:hypothetical protein FIBSPDRAFT_403431 [Athelia psychrophila]|uniref:Uncharacterized protein n=1 Tax=Athelia psychrophila TaxID=1759441 RepID=A0A166E2I2_9AGAM|nr:hypothetical protein FIBSPDRAFT_86599 [Fibularhizoctonia sp. CBS 109695]KZP25078.1 hypothetical protein FIBSPDRAFT_403431 [Fibularhizoctonia sp. CBS 109695]
MCAKSRNVNFSSTGQPGPESATSKKFDGVYMALPCRWELPKMSRAQNMQQGTVVECDVKVRTETVRRREWYNRETIRGCWEGGTYARRYGNSWESESETRRGYTIKEEGAKNSNGCIEICGYSDEISRVVYLFIFKIMFNLHWGGCPYGRGKLPKFCTYASCRSASKTGARDK